MCDPCMVVGQGWGHSTCRVLGRVVGVAHISSTKVLAAAAAAFMVVGPDA